MNKADCVIIGAGVIGLAIGRSLSFLGRDVLVLEENEHIGMGTSSRNSEVVHAGIYYPENSLKAKFCVQFDVNVFLGSGWNMKGFWHLSGIRLLLF